MAKVKSPPSRARVLAGGVAFPMDVMFGSTELRLWGGPYKNGPTPLSGVWMIKLAPEEPKAADVEVPIKDFGVPADDHHMACTILQALRRAIDGQRVFVGCLGGLGRTGTFLALLARACGEPNPVEYVRQSFRPAAVETTAQEIYVMDFPMELMKWGLRKLRLKLWLRDRGLTILADLV